MSASDCECVLFLQDKMDIDYNVNSELKKLQFFGAGPKAAVPQADEVKGNVKGLIFWYDIKS